MKKLVEDRSPSLGQTALRFILSYPAVSTVIPGAKSPEQVERNVAASALGSLSSEDIRLLEDFGKSFEVPSVRN